MKNYTKLLLLSILLLSCNTETKNKEDHISKEVIESIISKIVEENYDIIDNENIFKSGTIENFDREGRSIDVYWIGKEKDTTLRFYNKYDQNKELVGAEYYEEGDAEPSKDSIYTNSDGYKVVVSLNNDNKITWKLTTITDVHGNPILKKYENGRGEYRGLDSLFFDSKNRVIKGFYEYSNGRRSGIKTYTYIKSDTAGNWTERMMYVNDTLKQKQLRKITYNNVNSI